jgi:hypothetical protein
MNNKRRKKQKLKAQWVREKLFVARDSGSTIDQLVTDLVQNGPSCSSVRVLPQHQQNALLARFEKIRQSSNQRREQTGDWVILAEKLRRQLLFKYGTPDTPAMKEEQSKMPPGFAYSLRQGGSSLLKYEHGGDNGNDSIATFSKAMDKTDLNNHFGSWSSRIPTAWRKHCLWTARTDYCLSAIYYCI